MENSFSTVLLWLGGTGSAAWNKQEAVCKPEQCACRHRADPGCVGVVSPHPICGLSLGFGWDLLCFSQLNYKILPFLTNFTYQVST